MMVRMNCRGLMIHGRIKETTKHATRKHATAAIMFDSNGDGCCCGWLNENNRRGKPSNAEAPASKIRSLNQAWNNAVIADTND